MRRPALPPRAGGDDDVRVVRFAGRAEEVPPPAKPDDLAGWILNYQDYRFLMPKTLCQELTRQLKIMSLTIKLAQAVE